MTNLTKDIREQIVQSVLAGTWIPEKKAAILKSTGEAIREVWRKYLPEGFEAATATLPPAWFPKESVEYLSCAVNPDLIMQPTNSRGEKCSSSNFSVPPLAVPENFRPEYRYNGVGHIPFWSEALAPQIKEAQKLRAAQDKLEEELRGFLYSVKTYKQVLEKMPELERHLPKPAAKPMPVATSTAPLLSTLAKLGFDKGAPK